MILTENYLKILNEGYKFNTAEKTNQSKQLLSEMKVEPVAPIKNANPSNKKKIKIGGLSFKEYLEKLQKEEPHKEEKSQESSTPKNFKINNYYYTGECKYCHKPLLFGQTVCSDCAKK